jgi:hypothetical protein
VWPRLKKLKNRFKDLRSSTGSRLFKSVTVISSSQPPKPRKLYKPLEPVEPFELLEPLEPLERFKTFPPRFSTAPISVSPVTFKI